MDNRKKIPIPQKKGAENMKMCLKLLKRVCLLMAVIAVCSGFVVVGKGYTVYREALEDIRGTSRALYSGSDGRGGQAFPQPQGSGFDSHMQGCDQ